MLDLVQTSTFKKNLKKYKHKSSILDELDYIVELLVHEKQIPQKYKNHFLTGKFQKYTNVQELHLKPDDLLVYLKIENHSITLLAIGSHADLFG
ncbi:MAG TPA: type II toxin-antitoxin system mRNA interferase toxin, RelE/StbE family [Aquella sp.]|nr:type II toxin-antitoxin system mRNA interferase toxin, RelE/StbE family [Aquella sp.]